MSRWHRVWRRTKSVLSFVADVIIDTLTDPW